MERYTVVDRWTALVALVGATACAKPACDAGYGLAADGKCYPIYDPNHPPWADGSTSSTTDATTNGGAGGGAGGGSGAGGDDGAVVLPSVTGTYTISSAAPTTAGTGVWVAVWPAGALATAIPVNDTPLAEGEFPVQAPDSAAFFQILVDGVGSSGLSIDVSAILIQGDGDLSDDPQGVWAAGPATLTADRNVEGVNIEIR